MPSGRRFTSSEITQPIKKSLDEDHGIYRDPSDPKKI
jgi:hypothetical protein